MEKHSIVSIGTYGVVKTKEEKSNFKSGLEAMIDYLEPEIILVYGSMPEDIFNEYNHLARFVKYPDWTSYVKNEDV